jgi:hypothetical protein
VKELSPGSDSGELMEMSIGKESRRNGKNKEGMKKAEYK